MLYRDLSPLMLACIEGNATGVSTILARHDVNVNIIGKDGVTAISLACLQGNMEIVQMLLACREVNINKMTVDGVTPFTVSIFKGHSQITSLLMERTELRLGHEVETRHGHIAGRDIDAIDPLHVAAAKGQVQIVRKLIR